MILDVVLLVSRYQYYLELVDLNCFCFRVLPVRLCGLLSFLFCFCKDFLLFKPVPCTLTQKFD